MKTSACPQWSPPSATWSNVPNLLSNKIGNMQLQIKHYLGSIFLQLLFTGLLVPPNGPALSAYAFFSVITVHLVFYLFRRSIPKNLDQSSRRFWLRCSSLVVCFFINLILILLLISLCTWRAENATGRARPRDRPSSIGHALYPYQLNWKDSGAFLIGCCTWDWMCTTDNENVGLSPMIRFVSNSLAIQP